MLMPYADRQRPKNNNSFHFFNFNPKLGIALTHNINVRGKNTTKCALNEGIFQTHACLYPVSSVHTQIWRLDCILIFDHITPRLLKQWRESEAGETSCGPWVKSGPGSICVWSTKLGLVFTSNGL